MGKASETQILNLIDELWNQYGNEPWLEELVENGEGGIWLRKLAVELLETGSDAVTLTALRAGSHRL